MIRPFTLLCGVFAAGSMLYLYQSKHQAQMLDREIAHTLKAADDVKARIGMLRAEYQMLNDPARLQELADKHLALRPTAPTQFTILTDIARRLPPVELAPPELPPEPPETELFELPPAPPPAPAVVAAPPPAVAAAPKPTAPAPRPAPPPVTASAPPQSAKPTVLATAPAVPAIRTASLPPPSVTPAVPAPAMPARPVGPVSAIAASRAGIAATPLPAPAMPTATQQVVQRPQIQQVSAVRPVPESRPAFASSLGMARSVIRPAPAMPAANFDGPAR